MALLPIRKSVLFAFTWMFVTTFWWMSATSLAPTFQIYAKNGRIIDTPRTEYLLDPEYTTRIGYELVPDMRIGFDSKRGLGIVMGF